MHPDEEEGELGGELVRCVLDEGRTRYVGDYEHALFMMPDGRLLGGPRNREGGAHAHIVRPCLSRLDIDYDRDNPERAFMRLTGATRLVMGRKSAEFEAVTRPGLTDAQMRGLRGFCLSQPRCFWDVDAPAPDSATRVERCAHVGDLWGEPDQNWREFTQEYRRCREDKP